MSDSISIEKLNATDTSIVSSLGMPLGRIPKSLLKENSISEKWIRVMMGIFFLSIGLVAAASTINKGEYSWKAYVVPMVVTVNFLCGFFLNQRILVPRFYFARRIKLFVFFNFLFTIASILIRDIAIYLMGTGAGCVYEVLGTGRSFLTILSIFGIFIVVTGINCVFNVMVRLEGIRMQESYIRKLQENFMLQADLTFLKQQLSPHFLFNTLNNITALVDIDPKLAQKSMVRLSSLLRQVLQETQERSVAIETEVDILQKYCELEKLRFGSNVEFSFDVRLEHPEKNVSPLLMMPLVENAIKYGVHPSQKSRIAISISEKEDVLHCHVENTIVPKASSTHVKSGIGLANLQRRLEVCYPNRYQYLAKKENGVYIADLQISVKDTPLSFAQTMDHAERVFNSVDGFEKAVHG